MTLPKKMICVSEGLHIGDGRRKTIKRKEETATTITLWSVINVKKLQ